MSALGEAANDELDAAYAAAQARCVQMLLRSLNEQLVTGCIVEDFHGAAGAFSEEQEILT